MLVKITTLKSSKKTNKVTGITLLELMVVVAIFSLIAILAVPNYREINRQKQVNQLASTLESSLQIAHRQAMISARTVSICPTANLRETPIICLKKWENLENADKQLRGWIVFQDKNDNKSRETTETLYKKVAYDTSLAKLSWTGRSAVIKIFPRGSSGSSGTMRVYAPIGNLKLDDWKGKTTPVNQTLFEKRIVLSTLGKITYKNQ